jgi:hypothetical protein
VRLSFAYSLGFSFSSLHPESLWLASGSILCGTPPAQGANIFSKV